MVETRVIVTHPVGLHARPASLFVQAAKKFKSQIRVQNVTAGGKAVDAKSILGLLTLGVMQNHEIHIQADGEDAEAAVSGLSSLVSSDFGEK
jgi:phosphotransferase system HPr (HPr) family protein